MLWESASRVKSPPSPRCYRAAVEPRTTAGDATSRVGLLGNPSDIYGGKAIAFALANFEARVELSPDRQLGIDVGGPHGLRASHLKALGPPPRAGFDGAAPLLQAACLRFLREVPEVAALGDGDPRLTFQLTFSTQIPRQVGLAGSSALVIAALRALAAWFGVSLAPGRLAAMALAAETEDLGITAGPMDREVQARGGLLAMDFATGADAPAVLDPGCLPPLFLGFDPRGGEHSGSVHRNVRERWQAGDPDVREAMAIFPELVDEGLECLSCGDFKTFRTLVDRNFDTRARLFSIAPRDRQMIEIARGLGAAAKICGSGGAVVGVLREPSDYPPVAAAFGDAGFQTILPTIAQAPVVSP